MSKKVGYALAIGGLILVALTVPIVQEIIPVSSYIPSSITSTILIAVGLAGVVIGAIMLKGSGKGKHRGEEVPIYEGKKIVGYRRHN